MNITILSLDPGSHNFAASVIKNNKTGPVIVGTKMISSLLTDVKKAQEQSELFRNEIVALYSKYKFSHIVAERYQTRGIKGKTVECINLMLGVLLNEFYDLEITLLTAATWKNQYNRKNNLNDLYLDLKDAEAKKKTKDRKQIHELDCSLMGVYRMCAIQKVPYFSTIDNYMSEKRFLKHFLESPKL